MASAPGEQDELLQKLRGLFNASGEKEDEFGSEMADDARVWKVYAKAARKHDGELLAQWNGTLDTLLIFAGLFSAVSTTFIIDSYKQMQPDYAQETFKLLLANVSDTRYVEPSGRVGESARALNCLWISSLIASLSTALIAILAKQWLASYPVSDRENLREWAQLRQYRFDALESWHLPVLIAVVPVLLHVSLMLFLAGLVVFLWDIDTGTMVLALALSAGTYGLYGFTTLSPVLWSSSPFRTPLTPVLQRTVYHCVDYAADAIYRLSRVVQRIARRTGSSIRDVLAAVACHPGVETLSPATSTTYRSYYTTVHAVTRSVVTVMDRIYCLYCMAVRISRRCVDSLIDKVLTAVISPTGVTLYSLAICTILWFVAVFLAIDTLAFIYRFCCTAVWSRTRNMLHRLARGILSRPLPSALPVDPWITQTVFSDLVAASAFSWLGLNAETTDIYYAALYGLGDAVRGVTVADHLAPPLKTRISVQTTDHTTPYVYSDLDIVVMHLRAAYHLRNMLPSHTAAQWFSDQVGEVQKDKAKLRTPRDYDTLLRVSALSDRTIAYRFLAYFFGCQAGQKACESPSSILPSTARSIAQLFIDTEEPGSDTEYRSNVLAMLHALRSHFVESPDLAANLLRCSFPAEEGLIEDSKPLRGRSALFARTLWPRPAPRTAKPLHDCGRASCEAIAYLVAILTRHNFEDSDSRYMSYTVQVSLKAKTFETFAFFCREFQVSKPCTHLESNLIFWLSGTNPLSEISLCGRDIASFLPYCNSLSVDTRIHTIRHLLHPSHSWCAPNSPDPSRGDALNTCLVCVDLLDFTLPEVQLLLNDAYLEPLLRAPKWHDFCVLEQCATALAGADDNGSDIEGLVSKFIFCTAKGGTSGTTTRTWDLVVVAPQHILVEATSDLGYAGYLRDLCQSLGKLRQRYPHNARWKEMGDRVRDGASFLNDPSWRRSKGDQAASIQKTIEEFCSVMDPEEGRPETHTLGPQALAASRTAADVSDMDTDTAHKFLEWQVDGVY